MHRASLGAIHPDFKLAPQKSTVFQHPVRYNLVLGSSPSSCPLISAS